MSSLLVSDGMLFFETHDIIEEDIKHIIKIIQRFFTIQSRRKIISSNPLMPNRIFFVLSKRKLRMNDGKQRNVILKSITRTEMSI